MNYTVMRPASVVLAAMLFATTAVFASELRTDGKPLAPLAVLAKPAAPKAYVAETGRAQPAHRIQPPRGRQCFNQAETRDNIAAHRLTEPFHVLRLGSAQGEALRARLCRWTPDEYVYEVSVLRRDGHVIHLYMNAKNGQTVGAVNDAEPK